MMTAITKLVDKFTKQKGGTLPWINNEIRKLMKKRDLALKKSLHSKLNSDHLAFKGLRNKVVQELRKAQASYYTNLIGNAKGNSNSLWKHLNVLTNKTIKTKGIRELIVNGKRINKSATMANGFKTYFVQLVEELTRDFKENVGGNEPCLMPSADSFCIG